MNTEDQPNHPDNEVVNSYPPTDESLLVEASRFLAALPRRYSNLTEWDEEVCHRLATDLRRAALHSLPRTKGDPLYFAPEVAMPYARDLPPAPARLTPLDDLIPIMRQTQEP